MLMAEQKSEAVFANKILKNKINSIDNQKAKVWK